MFRLSAILQEKKQSPKGIKWSAVPLPCLTIVFQFVGFEFSLSKQGSGPGRGRSPVEWGDFRPSVRPKRPLGSPSQV